MLVVNRQRLGGFPRDRRRASAYIQQLTPTRSCFLVEPRPAPRERQQPQRFDSDHVVRAARRAAAVDRMAIRSARARLAAGARIDMAEGERLLRVACGLGAYARQMQQPRRERRERQQVEPVVLEDGRDRPGISGANEAKITARNLKAGHVADATRAQDLLLESDERAAPVPVPYTCPPKPSRRMQHVEVREPPADPGQPVKQVPRLEHRRIKRFAVEADERAGARELDGHGFEKRPLVGVPGEQELPRDERPVVPRSKNINGGGAGAPAVYMRASLDVSSSS